MRANGLNNRTTFLAFPLPQGRFFLLSPLHFYAKSVWQSLTKYEQMNMILLRKRSVYLLGAFCISRD